MIIKYKNNRGKRVVTTCFNCKNKFETLSAKLLRGNEKFCSLNCYQLNRSLNKKDSIKLQRIHKRKCLYGITEIQYNEMYSKQNGLCYICNISLNINNEAIDHCHKTNKIRGILCKKCNSGLGMFNDNILNLQNAINYLILHK